MFPDTNMVSDTNTRDEQIHRIQTEARESVDKISQKYQLDFEKRIEIFDKLEKQTQETRTASREVVYKIILISASIVGFLCR